MTGVPVGLVVTIQAGEDEAVSRALAQLPEDAFTEVGGHHAAFVGDGQVFIFWESALPDVSERLSSSSAAAPLRDVLEDFTNFDARAPGRSLLVDAHHVLDAPPGMMEGPWEGDM